MNTDQQFDSGSTARRYEALLRISEMISACTDPEDLAQVLADQLDGVLHFDHLDLLALKENPNEIEWHAWGKGALPLPDEPIEEWPIWQVYNCQEPLHIVDLSRDERFPRLKHWAELAGVACGSVACVPLTTLRRRLGTFSIASHAGGSYSTEDLCFLQLVGRVVAFALDDGLNLRKAEAAQAELRQQNSRLQLLLDLTNRITSNLELREVLRAISANIREVMECDGAAILLPHPVSGNFQMYALDFPSSRGFFKEELLIVPGQNDPAQRALDTLQPVIINTVNAADISRESYETVVAEGLKCHCFIPLANRGRAVGLLVVGRTREGDFTPKDIEFLSQASGQIAIAVENALAFQEISELKEKLSQEKLYLEEEIRSEMNFDEIVGNSAALRQVLELVETVARSDSTVLLLGETGTGKELIARAIHDHSPRKNHTFVKLNCAAIPTGLLESELFGHEKGAFTGAISQKIGRLELADQGTLFLDEVGDVPLEIQPKLLRALQEREFERLGSTRTKKVSVRLVAATNRDLESMIAAREFRSDLYYRLNVFPIRIPPLRERREDIPLLVSYFVQKFAQQMQKRIETIPAAAIRTLTEWDWPGNVRELGNFIERAVILTRGSSLEAPLAELRKLPLDEPTTTAAHRQEEIALIVKETLTALNSQKTEADEHARKQREKIVSVLTESKGRVGGTDGAAARLGLNRTTLLSRMKKLGIDPKQFS